MTLQQEAYMLMSRQSEQTIKLLIELMKALDANAGNVDERVSGGKNEIIGAGRDIIKLPDDFFEHFDDSNDEIAEMFYGSDE